MEKHLHISAASFLVFLCYYLLCSAMLKIAAAWLVTRHESAGSSLAAIAA